MGTNAVLAYLKDQLDGQPVGDWGQIEAHVMPLPGDLQTQTSPPRVYLWPSDENETHPTMSGPGGYRRVEYSLDLQVRVVVAPDDSRIEQFWVLPDAVKSLVRAIAKQTVSGNPSIPITDPATQQGSYLTIIGDGFKTRNRSPRILTNLPVTLIAQITAPVQEQIQA